MPKIYGLNGRLPPLKVYAAVLSVGNYPFKSCEVLTFEVSDCVQGLGGRV